MDMSEPTDVEATDEDVLQALAYMMKYAAQYGLIAYPTRPCTTAP